MSNAEERTKRGRERVTGLDDSAREPDHVQDEDREINSNSHVERGGENFTPIRDM